MGGRCASDAFATSMAAQLAGLRGDSTGSFTDSANYATALIPECTNLSVGYESAHSPQESLDYFHLIGLRDSLLALDYSKLIVERTPAADDYDDYWQAGAYSVKSTDSRIIGKDCRSVYDFCESYPDIVADLLEQYGITLQDLYDSAPYLN